MESQNWQWSTSCAGDRPALWIGMFRYCKMAQATLSLSKEPWGDVFPFTILFAVFTTSTAWPLDWGYMKVNSLCLIYHILRNSSIILEVKGRPPSVLTSSGVPYVWNNCWQMNVNLDLVAWPGYQDDRLLWLTGAMFEHTMQFALILHIEASIPGQYTNSLACAFMPTTLWCVKCRRCRTFLCCILGMTTLQSNNTRPLPVLRWFLTSQYSRTLGAVRLCVRLSH